ncbi:hypothetical protein C8F04DRAFT_1191578 [Mycena alexandri]|nr:hypothetical protein C8F04DRAFT_1191578 [Mycena alexandri]
MADVDSTMPPVEDVSDDSDSDGEPDSSSTCAAEEGPSLSKIDGDCDDIQHGDCDDIQHCDMCPKTLGATADAGTRAFRCHSCELSVQCETCCSQAHLMKDTHVIQEWNNISREWGEQVGMPDVMSSLAKNCGSCNTHLAAPNSVLPKKTVLCLDCGPSLLCGLCFQSKHKLRALHRVRIWDQGWRASTLAELGFEYSLGHDGSACLWPLETTWLKVITYGGYHNIRVKYCGCGKFEAGELGRWQQVRAMGFHRAGIISSSVCATFRVLSPEQEKEYDPEPSSY